MKYFAYANVNEMHAAMRIIFPSIINAAQKRASYPRHNPLQ